MQPIRDYDQILDFALKHWKHEDWSTAFYLMDSEDEKRSIVLTKSTNYSDGSEDTKISLISFRYENGFGNEVVIFTKVPTPEESDAILDTMTQAQKRDEAARIKEAAEDFWEGYE